MTEDNAAPAAAPDSRNLVMRIAVAAVLIPLAVAIAYAGGWLWTLLVTLAAIGLFVEWLAIVGLAGATRVMVPGVVALAVAGLCFAIGGNTCCFRKKSLILSTRVPGPGKFL